LIAEAKAHFADHCAICHANNGSGNTEIGRNLYPKAPDMRLPQTLNLTDGELYYTIHNGIRLTGMPATAYLSIRYAPSKVILLDWSVRRLGSAD